MPATIRAACAIAVAAVLSLPAAGAEPLREAITASRVVDLTHPMRGDMAVWPGGVPFRMTRLVDYDKGYRLHRFEMGENTGTHVDAPAHFIEGARPIDGLPLRDLVAPAVVIDVRARAAADPDFRLRAADVRAWERAHGPIPIGALVILNTGWHERFADPEAYVNMDSAGVMHFPGFHAGAADTLIARGVVGVGIDTLSLDHGPSEDFAFHRAMLGAGKYQIENMANLDALPARGAVVVVGVLPVREGTQAQARVLALLP